MIYQDRSPSLDRSFQDPKHYQINTFKGDYGKLAVQCYLALQASLMDPAFWET